MSRRQKREHEEIRERLVTIENHVMCLVHGHRWGRPKLVGPGEGTFEADGRLFRKLVVNRRRRGVTRRQCERCELVEDRLVSPEVYDKATR